VREAHWMLFLNMPLDRDGIVVDVPDTMCVPSARGPSREIAVLARGSAKRHQSPCRAWRENAFGQYRDGGQFK
jgi:hypothetical protein